MDQSNFVDALIRHRQEIIWFVVALALLPTAALVWMAIRKWFTRTTAPHTGFRRRPTLGVGIPGNILATWIPNRAVGRQSPSLPEATWKLFAAFQEFFSALFGTVRQNPKWAAAALGGLLIIVGGKLLWDRKQTQLVIAGLNFPPSQCARSPRAGAVVFIHGWSGDAQETWKRFPELMCADARFNAFEVVSIGYPTLMDARDLSIAQMAEWILEGLRDRVKIKEGEKVIFIAHSMGGLIAREITILRNLARAPGTVEILAELGPPHNEAAIAPLASALGFSHNLPKDMASDSGALKELQVSWNQLSPRPPTLCYSSPQDSVVAESSAFFQCDYQLAFPLWGHTELVKPESLNDDRYRLPTQEITSRLHLQ
jgi:hypothetical protein